MTASPHRRTGDDSAGAGGHRKRDDKDLVKSTLQARIDSLVRELLPDGHKAGRYWMAKNPTRDDHRGSSFWVLLAGTPGVWKDEATGETGDVLSLVGYVKGIDFRDTMQWARAWCGLGHLSDDRLRQARAEVRLRDERQARAEADRLLRERGRAFAAWLKASPALAGTPVDAYLMSRGIDLRALPRPPLALRFAMQNHSESGRPWPSMVALMTGPDPEGKKEGVPYAIHRTWLALDGSGKAPVEHQRKMWPSYAGAAIRLARGETGLQPSEAQKQGLVDTLCLCEGVEDGLSIALARPELRVWAVGALGNLGRIVPPACTGEIIVAADNDWGKAQAASLLDAGIDALLRTTQGRVPVKIARSFIGKDMNDALRNHR